MPYSLQRLAAGALLVTLSPLLAAISVAIVVLEGRPVFYRGPRLGKDRKTFDQLKFRSMVRDADRLLSGPLGTDAPKGRVTRIGKLLRSTSLDELPQLVNIAQGEMALVGPRPLLPDLADRIDADHPRFDVLPGLTGLSQVSGRNELVWSQRLVLDAEYVENRSLLNDLRILLRTVRVVALREGIAPDRNSAAVLDI